MFLPHPALSRWERENGRPYVDKVRAFGWLSDGLEGTLSQRERAGVRERASQIPRASKSCLRVRISEASLSRLIHQTYNGYGM